jgi:hypothetical protein
MQVDFQTLTEGILLIVLAHSFYVRVPLRIRMHPGWHRRYTDGVSASGRFDKFILPALLILREGSLVPCAEVTFGDLDAHQQRKIMDRARTH